MAGGVGQFDGGALVEPLARRPDAALTPSSARWAARLGGTGAPAWPYRHGVFSVPYRIRLPAGPVAAATTGIGRVQVTVLLGLHGTIEVRRHDPDADLLAALAGGLFVSGLDSAYPVVHATAGHRFDQLCSAFLPPDTMVFEGDCLLQLRTAGIDADGTPGYRLEIRAGWSGPNTSPQPTSAAEWSDRFGAALAAIGVIVLARAIAARFSTG